MAIGILKPEEAGAKARAAVEQWKKEKDAARIRTEAERRRAKPAPESHPAAPKQIGGGELRVVIVPDEETQKALDRKLKESLKPVDEGEAIKAIKSGANPNSYFHRNDTMMGPLFTGHNVGATVLMVAAMKGSMLLVEALLDAGAEINKTNHAGATAASFAIIAGKDDVLRLLATRGADIVRANQTVRNYLGVRANMPMPAVSDEERADVLHRMMGSIVW